MPEPISGRSDWKWLAALGVAVILLSALIAFAAVRTYTVYQQGRDLARLIERVDHLELERDAKWAAFDERMSSLERTTYTAPPTVPVPPSIERRQSALEVSTSKQIQELRDRITRLERARWEGR